MADFTNRNADETKEFILTFDENGGSPEYTKIEDANGIDRTAEVVELLGINDKASLSDLGSMAEQDSDDVDITGGEANFNNTPSVNGVRMAEKTIVYADAPPRDVWQVVEEVPSNFAGKYFATLTGSPGGDDTALAFFTVARGESSDAKATSVERLASVDDINDVFIRLNGNTVEVRRSSSGSGGARSVSVDRLRIK